MARFDRYHDDAIRGESVSASLVKHSVSPKTLGGGNQTIGALATLPERDGELFTAHLLRTLGAGAFELWFGSHTQIQIGDKVVQVNAETDFLVDCIQRFCQPELNNAVMQYFGGEYSLRLGIRQMATNGVGVNAQASKPKSSTTEGPNHLCVASDNAQPSHEDKPEPVAAPPLLKSQQPPKVNTAATVSDTNVPTKKPELPFVTGRSNRLAATAVDMVIDRPGELGLLFIYGPNGVGKTHLCKSVRERLRNRHGLRRVIYMRAEQFAIDFSESTRGAGFTAFRKKYRDVEGLIIDDAQFLLGKQGTLSELRNTVDDLLGRRRQLVFAADRPLSELVAMGTDLHARLSGGVSCSLEPLDKDLRRSVLAAICENHKVDLASETIDELAERASGDGRMLYGLVFRLLTQQRIAGGKLTHDQAISCLSDLFQASQPVLRLADIERVVCNSFGFEPKVLRDKSRSKNVTAARMLAMFLARRLTPAAYSEIGQYFGNRQHSTVISAQKRVENWLNSDEKLNHRGGAVSIREWVRNAETSLRLG